MDRQNTDRRYVVIHLDATDLAVGKTNLRNTMTMFVLCYVIPLAITNRLSIRLLRLDKELFPR